LIVLVALVIVLAGIFSRLYEVQFCTNLISRLKEHSTLGGRSKGLKNKDAREERDRQTWWQEELTKEGRFEVSLSLESKGLPQASLTLLLMPIISEIKPSLIFMVQQS